MAIEKKISLDDLFYGSISANEKAICTIAFNPCVIAYTPCIVGHFPCAPANIPSCPSDTPPSCPSDTPPSCPRDTPPSCPSDTPAQPDPSLSLSGGYEEFTWTISDLSASFTTTVYKRAGLTKYQFTSGGGTSISGIVAYKNATSSGSTTVSDTVEYDPGTYTFWAFTQTKDGTYWPAGSASVTVQKKKPVIAQWSWNISNGVGGSSGTASAAKTQAAYRAILNEGCGEDFSYKVWNDLVNKINEVVVAIGGTWANTYTTLGGTRMGTPGEVLTATMYNAAKQNVGSHFSTGIPEVNGDTEFTWSYIDKLASKLNEWIASL